MGVAHGFPGGRLLRVGSGFFAIAALSWPATAPALTQPGTNAQIPSDTDVLAALTALGETIDPLTDAAVTPETFRPECSLTFTLLTRLTDFKNSFGWYNVTDQGPALEDLHEFIHCDDPPANWQKEDEQTTRVLDIRAEPGYLGGEIGFFQARPFSGACADVTDASTVEFVVYSQPALNPEDTAEPFIHLIIMDSKIQSNVFYFAWEDLLSGGDNDFSDLVIRVEGITCSGGGEPCDTGQQGVCGPGLTQCVNGEITCVPRVAAGDETCNGLDDDCDGAVDDGDLCGENQICDRGVCIPVCGGGEFRCLSGTVCRGDGYCVDPACETVTCDQGLICRGGDCVDPCSGIVCPHAQECRGGRCMDPCEGVDCGENLVCVQGACLTTCECSGCSGGQVCDQRVCVEESCNAVSCDTGTHCEAGACVDDCAGAACPPGQACVLGLCEGEITQPEPGSGGGISLDGGIVLTGGASSGASTGAGSNGSGASSGNEGGGASRDRGDAASGCGCRLGDGAGARLSAFALAALAGASMLRRRRKRFAARPAP